MAGKRMFSKEITSSDAFLDMPASTQALYFHLGMEADDDGFIGNPKKVMRVIGVSDDDLKILLSKRFLLSFPSGVLVVKHHRINNNWDKYNCKRTPYIEEFSSLNIKDNKAYTLDKSQGIPVVSDNSLKTVFRIEENRIDNTREAPLRIETFNEDGEERKKSERVDSKARAAYESLLQWAESQRGTKFTNRIKQYSALKTAKAAGLKASDLKERWEEMEGDEFWEKKGFDWTNVVASFNRKPIAK